MIGQGTNRTFPAIAIAAGMDVCIHDPRDTELMNEMTTAARLLNRTIYSDPYIKEYHQSK